MLDIYLTWQLNVLKEGCGLIYQLIATNHRQINNDGALRATVGQCHAWYASQRLWRHYKHDGGLRRSTEHTPTTPSALPVSHRSRNQWYIILAVTQDHRGGAFTSTGTITTHYQTPSDIHLRAALARPRGRPEAGASDWYTLWFSL